MTKGVYAITNRHTGQMYIGSTSNLKQRLINQRCFLKTGHRSGVNLGTKLGAYKRKRNESFR